MKKLTKGLFILGVLACFALVGCVLTVDLCEKDGEPAWECVEGAGPGTLAYYVCGFGQFKFIFDAVNLNDGIEYTLAYIPDPWPQTGLICLASGIPESDGSLHLEGAPVTGDLPKIGDDNYPTGAKIWLVPSTLIDCGTHEMIGWCAPGNTCDQILFEFDLIKFDDLLDS